MILNVKLTYPSGKEIVINGASSILNPKSNTVMFVGKKFADKIDNLITVENCLVFVLLDTHLPESIQKKHIIQFNQNPRKAFGKFLENNRAEERLETSYRNINDAIISTDSHLGKNVIIEPFSFVGSDVVIGENTIIHSGVRILPGTKIGENCEIHENTVIGTVGLAYEGDQRIPQIGNTIIGDNVAIGASCVIARGAINDTVIGNNVKIDSTCFISHNVHIGDNCFLVAGANLFGSVIVKDGAYISGNAVIRNGVSIGEGSVVGMGSVVIKDVLVNSVVVGNPARILEK